MCGNTTLQYTFFCCWHFDLVFGVSFSSVPRLNKVWGNTNFMRAIPSEATGRGWWRRLDRHNSRPLGCRRRGQWRRRLLCLLPQPERTWAEEEENAFLQIQQKEKRLRRRRFQLSRVRCVTSHRSQINFIALNCWCFSISRGSNKPWASRGGARGGSQSAGRGSSCATGDSSSGRMLGFMAMPTPQNQRPFLKPSFSLL